MKFWYWHMSFITFGKSNHKHRSGDYFRINWGSLCVG